MSVSDDTINSLERHAFHVIGRLPVADVELSHIMAILEPIWTTKTETATRVRQRLEAVLTWAKVGGYRSGENPARWDGNLKEILPNPSDSWQIGERSAVGCRSKAMSYR